MIHFEIIRILSISFIAYLFYKIFTGFDNNGKHVSKKDNENEKQIIEFDNKDLQTDFKLKFESIKNLSGDNYKAIKLINTLQFGTIQIEIFKGSAYSDFDNLHWVELRSLSNEYKTNEPIILSEMDTNDLIILLTFINKI